MADPYSANLRVLLDKIEEPKRTLNDLINTIIHGDGEEAAPIQVDPEYQEQERRRIDAIRAAAEGEQPDAPRWPGPGGWVKERELQVNELLDYIDSTSPPNIPVEGSGVVRLVPNVDPTVTVSNRNTVDGGNSNHSLAENSVRDGTAVAQNLRTYAEMQRAARMKAEADAFAAYEGLLGSEETPPHRGLATLLGETLGFKGNTWSQDFRDATHMDEPVVQKILAGLRGMGRRPSQFGDTALTELVGGFNIAEDRAIAGATAGQTASLEAFKAETERLTALKGKPPTGPELKMIKETGIQIQVANRLAELQDFLYGSRGGVTGGGFRGIGHGIGTLARFLGAETGTSEEDVYQSLRANVNSLLIEAATYDERWNKNMVRELVDKVLPKTGWTKSHKELEDAITTLLDTTQRRINNNQEILGYIGQGGVVGALHEAGRLGRSDFPGLVSIDGQPQ